MMKFVAAFFLTILLAFAGGLFLPWYSIALMAFLVAVAIPQRPGKAFLAAFFGVFLLWAGMSWWISFNNDHILAHKISLLFLKTDSPYLLIAVTGLIGGLVSGTAALAGRFLRHKAK